MASLRKIPSLRQISDGFGGIDALTDTSPGCTRDCHHDSDTFDDLGGGAEYRIRHDLWVRGDYEYELWTKFVSQQ